MPKLKIVDIEGEQMLKTLSYKAGFVTKINISSKILPTPLPKTSNIFTQIYLPHLLHFATLFSGHFAWQRKAPLEKNSLFLGIAQKGGGGLTLARIVVGTYLEKNCSSSNGDLFFFKSNQMAFDLVITDPKIKCSKCGGGGERGELQFWAKSK